MAADSGAAEWVIGNRYSPNYGATFTSASIALNTEGWHEGGDGLYRQHPEHGGYVQATALWLADIRRVMAWDEVASASEEGVQ